jgi:hypothetical protein
MYFVFSLSALAGENVKISKLNLKHLNENYIYKELTFLYP